MFEKEERNACNGAERMWASSEAGNSQFPKKTDGRKGKNTRRERSRMRHRPMQNNVVGEN
jgi:hypothetical protein